MNAYSAAFDQNAAATTTILGLTGSAAIRFYIYDIMLGSADTPGDQASHFQVERTTVAGTGGTSTAPEPLDPLSAASTTAAHYNPASEPTYTADSELLRFAVNQRATFRWVAAPGGELISVLGAATGIGLKFEASTGTYAVQGCIHFRE